MHLDYLYPKLPPGTPASTSHSYGYPHHVPLTLLCHVLLVVNSLIQFVCLLEHWLGTGAGPGDSSPQQPPTLWLHILPARLPQRSQGLGDGLR